MIFLCWSLKTLNSHGWPIFTNNHCGPADRELEGRFERPGFKSLSAIIIFYVINKCHIRKFNLENFFPYMTFNLEKKSFWQVFALKLRALRYRNWVQPKFISKSFGSGPLPTSSPCKGGNTAYLLRYVRVFFFFPPDAGDIEWNASQASADAENDADADADAGRKEGKRRRDARMIPRLGFEGRARFFLLLGFPVLR